MCTCDTMRCPMLSLLPNGRLQVSCKENLRYSPLQHIDKGIKSAPSDRDRARALIGSSYSNVVLTYTTSYYRWHCCLIDSPLILFYPVCTLPMSFVVCKYLKGNLIVVWAEERNNPWKEPFLIASNKLGEEENQYGRTPTRKCCAQRFSSLRISDDIL
jgi:hypothetical protein